VLQGAGPNHSNKTLQNLTEDRIRCLQVRSSACARTSSVPAPCF